MRPRIGCGLCFRDGWLRLDPYFRDVLRVEGNDGPGRPLPQIDFLAEVEVMLKLSFWVGTPSTITYLAWADSGLLENILFIFVLSVAALLVAILPQINEKAKS